MVAVGASLAALIALVCTNPGTFWQQTDAAVYRGAGASVWAHDGNLYTTLFGPARLPFTYPPFAANWSGLKFHVSGLLRLVPYGSRRELHWNVLQTVAGNYYLWCVLAFLVVAHRMTSNSRDRQKQAGERPSAVGTKSEA